MLILPTHRTDVLKYTSHTDSEILLIGIVESGEPESYRDYGSPDWLMDFRH